MGVRLPAKAGEIVNGDLAAWVLVESAAEAAGECQCESSCSLAALLGAPKGPISLTEIKGCPALGAEEFDPTELVECYCLISASRATKPSVDSIMDTADRELAQAKTEDERLDALAKAGRAGEKRRKKMIQLYSSLVHASLSS